MTHIATLSLILRIVTNLLGLPLVAGAVLALGGATGDAALTTAYAQEGARTVPVVTLEELLKLTEKEVLEKVKSKSAVKARV
ncbi:hypothetical protein ACFFMN_06900 [Planobispora siamensis]|uniref:Uncharacterized protein n=1 Tax=Planobispora siamensis TaxID=936338 RepID=A0A8J3SJQ0_9ACTN|nr:hypothetical protein [Planobispora siamensis]GIH95542.1 hypothetical protein Psi01_61720 [Planobispora siamensis]